MRVAYASCFGAICNRVLAFLSTGRLSSPHSYESTKCCACTVTCIYSSPTKAVPMTGVSQSNRPHVAQELLFSSLSSAVSTIPVLCWARSRQMSKLRAAQLAVTERQAADNPGMDT